MKDQIQYWAHMLDESSHASYYDVYMQEHPEDKLPRLIDSLIAEFAESLHKDNIDLEDCLANGKVNYESLEKLQQKVKSVYYWERIKATTYAAIISRMVALSHRAKGQRLSEDEIQFDDVAHLVSRKTIEDCLDIMCHNTNVLEANNCIVNSLDNIKSVKNHDQVSGSIQTIVNNAFEKHGIPKLPRHDTWKDQDVDDYLAALVLYKKWGSYAKGNAGEPYVCDSDNGPEPLKKVLSSVEYSADTIDLIVALNKSLDIVHFRSDLAAAFIEGGQQTCALVSNLPDKFVI